MERLSKRLEPAAHPPAIVWVCWLVAPFGFALVLRVFPLDVKEATAVVLLVLLLLTALSMFGGTVRGTLIVVAGPILLLAIGSLPAWLELGASTVGGRQVAPVYSYRDAKANPQAFTNWWNYFVSEVIRTNGVVLERDPQGEPFNGVLPYRLIPGRTARFHNGKIEINNKGYRGDDIPNEKGDTYRIVTIGDSATFGQSLFPDSRTWSAVLQDILRDRLVCRKKLVVINGGVNAFRVSDAINRIERDFAWLKPDLVVSYFGWNATEELSIAQQVPRSVTPPRDANRSALLGWYIRRAAESLVSTLRLLIVEPFRDDLGIRSDALMPHARQSKLYSYYSRLIEQSQRLGYKLVFASFNTALTPDSPEDAFRFYSGPWPDIATTIMKIHLNNRLIRELAAAHEQVWFIDTGAEIYGRYDSDLFIDIVHFTPKGDAKMARNLAEKLMPILIDDKNLKCH